MSKKVGIFENIGYSDFSSLVDVSSIRKIAKGKGLEVYPLLNQSHF